MNPAKVARCINKLPCSAHPERTGDDRIEEVAKEQLEIHREAIEKIPLESTGDWESRYEERFPEMVERAVYDGLTKRAIRNFNLRTREVKAFIATEIEKRDAYWQAQEMGVSSDCAEHEEKARAEERARIREKLEALKGEKPRIDGDNFDCGWHDAITEVLSALSDALTVVDEEGV